jgi:hypothetical protein
MRVVRRVERAAEQANAHIGRYHRQLRDIRLGCLRLMFGIALTIGVLLLDLLLFRQGAPKRT